jgi:hypothetical protein
MLRLTAICLPGAQHRSAQIMELAFSSEAE